MPVDELHQGFRVASVFLGADFADAGERRQGAWFCCAAKRHRLPASDVYAHKLQEKARLRYRKPHNSNEYHLCSGGSRGFRGFKIKPLGEFVPSLNIRTDLPFW